MPLCFDLLFFVVLLLSFSKSWIFKATSYTLAQASHTLILCRRCEGVCGGVLNPNNTASSSWPQSFTVGRRHIYISQQGVGATSWRPLWTKRIDVKSFKKLVYLLTTSLPFQNWRWQSVNIVAIGTVNWSSSLRRRPRRSSTNSRSSRRRSDSTSR
ncbi:uncharacterized protein LOC117787898 [Drosophila innubila]|uniref:uncharacterized protein LOC117787898 n=1 Tax=Drosophila innubila TaxID=198719 RepID=UPI00148BFC88|nr:uncharacterized protein LOC117787898 [Drosophila innubila]